MMLVRFSLAALMLFSTCSYGVISPPVKLDISGMRAVLDNGLLRVEFNDDASMHTMTKNGHNLVSSLSGAARDPSKNRSGYLDFHSDGVKDFIPERLEVIARNDDIAHIAWFNHPGSLLRLEYHLIMRKGVSGIYSYVIAENTGDKNIKVSELRNVYRFNPGYLDHIFNGERDGKPYLYHELEAMPAIQDETWRLPDGSVWTKYDFAGYQRTTPFWGVYGKNSGVWLIHASGEYFSGDTLKQDLMVHQDAIILNYLTGAHLGTPDMHAPPGWKKFYGPWLLYVNEGDKAHMLADARQQSDSEKASWPYRWLNDAQYPVERTQVSGRVKTDKPVTLVLSSSIDEQFDLQTRGYLFSAVSDEQGNFQFEHVIPGDYQLIVYANSGTQPGLLVEKQMTVSGEKQWLDQISLPPAAKVIWAIGQSDRQAKEFRFGNEQRNYRWQHEVPANLVFNVGHSDFSQEWYYAQTKPGNWDINFNLTPEKAVYHLNIALAAASNSGMVKGRGSPSLTVKINGAELKTLTYENDKAVYRSALRNGQYHLATISVEKEQLRNGKNTLSLQLNGGSLMYDIITFTE
ncbi:rhamnogalacturonate lyase [Erwinia tracheiphila]|nr:polysaccharide lyase family protein [Erwinia tracheiphila]UIA84260.1 rhamnogalacturonate lyase [Erwinia tracheiphila]UIA92840.1 rhamnogalacturonate lyase [Erwinia tracheiphila]